MPGSVTHFADVTIDYGDVQMLRAMLGAATVFGYTLHTWNLNAQFGAVSNIVMTDKSVKAIFDANPGLLTDRQPERSRPARAAFTNAIALLHGGVAIHSQPSAGRAAFCSIWT